MSYVAATFIKEIGLRWKFRSEAKKRKVSLGESEGKIIYYTMSGAL